MYLSFQLISNFSTFKLDKFTFRFKFEHDFKLTIGIEFEDERHENSFLIKLVVTIIFYNYLPTF